MEKRRLQVIVVLSLSCSTLARYGLQRPLAGDLISWNRSPKGNWVKVHLVLAARQVLGVPVLLEVVLYLPPAAWEHCPLVVSLQQQGPIKPSNLNN